MAPSGCLSRMYLPFPVDGNVDINSLPIGFNDADADGADCAADVADCTGDDSSAVAVSYTHLTLPTIRSV